MAETRPAQMRIQPLARYMPPTVEFVLAAAGESGLGRRERDRLRTIMQLTLAELIENAHRGAFEDAIEISFDESWHQLRIELLNKGLPLFSSLKRLQENLLRQADIGPREMRVENLGRGGQKLVFEIPLDIEHAIAVERSYAPDASGDIRIRPLADGEEAALSELFFNVYEYNYINEYVYYPERLREMRESGQLTSFVGVTEKNEIVGHVGLVRLNANPTVYEAALGAVDPRIKSRGLFSRIFHHTMEFAQQQPMSYRVFDFVTNHDFSQKLVARYGTRDLALFVGCQGKETQASLNKLGLGDDPTDMDRYTLLLSVALQERHPFGKNVPLPSTLGETLGFVLEQIGVSWTPVPRFDLLSRDGEFTAARQPAQKAVIFDLQQPGRAAVRRLLEMWQSLMREGYQYAGINVPIAAPGLGHLYDLLAAHGFFMGGFLPYRNSNQLGFRFQALGPSRVAFDRIKVCTETSQRLLACVKADYERNCLI